MSKLTWTITPQSPFRTPLQSDTLFGHICWAIRYALGEDRLVAFLHAYGPDHAPLLVSSGCPRGFLPMPVLKSITVEKEETLREKYFPKDEKRLDFYRALKRLSKTRYISHRLFSDVRDNLSAYEIYDFCFSKGLENNPDIIFSDEELPFDVSVETWHSEKNRLTDRAAHGKLYPLEDTFFREGTAFTVYLSNECFTPNELSSILEYIAVEGYGADKSVGRGAFSYELTAGWDLPAASDPNGYMTLSHYHPTTGETVDGYYDVSTKFGKLGGHWAAGVEGGPHKKPLLMFNPGSCFKSATPKSFYGGLIRGVHAKPEVVHYGIALPLPVRFT
ncbi:MAG: hypothetical protein ED859_11730 [Desulfuromonadales bacterium]|nr:MAG: hypothetical protein ED859_11730 [Desulfuromonadales bacterium]